MLILGIDPGEKESAWVVWDTEKIISMAIDNNDMIWRAVGAMPPGSIMGIEMVACYGMPVGKSVFETVKWIGKIEREAEIKNIPYYEVFRRNIKMHFCNNMKAKDSNIRQALIDRFGSPGTKKKPGKLYGVKKDIWSALAIAVYTEYKLKEEK